MVDAVGCFFKGWRVDSQSPFSSELETVAREGEVGDWGRESGAETCGLL